jgi:hypothetical protein
MGSKYQINGRKSWNSAKIGDEFLNKNPSAINYGDYE